MSKIKTAEEIARDISRKHGMKAKKVLKEKFGPDAYNVIREKGLKVRKQNSSSK